jgi:hypothetical protein
MRNAEGALRAARAGTGRAASLRQIAEQAALTWLYASIAYA